MTTRRLSTAEKGKSTAVDPYQAPRKGRIQIEEPENAYLTHKHSLTLIGRVTNPSMQKISALIAFFTDHWVTERKPVGADLGQGMFQFQFELESDLLSVLEKRPYHYARWMVILQRWEPTTSPHFPSLIPFWIKVQGIPVHLWTEGTIRQLGEDIGIYEAADITSLTARMKVHINGRLPLIKRSVIEYKGGNEVTAHFVYEKLERHCSVCNRLDHEVRDCLEAKARKREALKEKEAAEAPPPRENIADQRTARHEESRSSLYSEDKRDTRHGNEAEDYYRGRRNHYDTGKYRQRDSYHPYKRPLRDSLEDRESHQQASHYQRHRHERNHSHDSHSREFVYRPVRRPSPLTRDILGTPMERHSTKELVTPTSKREILNVGNDPLHKACNSTDRGDPLREPQIPNHIEAMDKALGRSVTI